MGFSVFMWSAMWVIQLIVSLCGVQWVSVSVEHNVGFSVCEHDVEFQCVEHDVGFSVCVEHGVGFSVCVECGVDFQCLCGAWCGF